MPNRILRDGILRSQRIARLGWAEEVFYRRLHSVVDDFGLYYADPGMLRADCYPRQLGKVSETDVAQWLAACVAAELVTVYQADDGESYLQVLKFRQQIRVQRSKFPSPPSECVADAAQLKSNEHLGVFGGEGVKKERNPSGYESDRDESRSDPPQAADMDESGTDAPSDAAPSVEKCPVQAIVKLYHETLPELPACVKLTEARKGYIRQRWREDMPEMDHWRNFFAHVRESRFLMGQAAARNGSPPFIANLEWLTRPANFAKIAEGKYHR